MVEQIEYFLNDTFITPFNYMEGAEDGTYIFFTNGVRFAAYEVETGDIHFAEDNDFNFIHDNYLSMWTRKMVKQ